jgi:hypothetical protein
MPRLQFPYRVLPENPFLLIYGGTSGAILDPSYQRARTTSYKKKHTVKLGTDSAELTKLMAAFETIQDVISL